MGEQIILLLVIVLAIVASAGALVPDCSDKLQLCGDVEIPYPFSITEGCSPYSDFLLNCNTSTTPNTLMLGNLQVTNITLQGQLKIQMFVARKCYNQSGNLESFVSATLQTTSYTVSSTENKFVAVGCDTYGYLNSFQANGNSSTGCLSRCNRNTPDLETNNGDCSGIGCCQVDIPPGMNNISIEAYSFNNHINVWDINNCSYAFVAERDWFKYSYDNLKFLPDNMVPMVFDWAIGDETCEIAKQNTANYVCTGPNTKCSNSNNGSGYRCECKKGFEGNPYLPGGCQDFNECQDDTKNNCLSKENCRNINGSYECFCPPGQYGNGTKEDGPCEQKKKKDVLKWIIVGVSTGFVALFVCISWIYLVIKQRNLIKLKEKFFRKNGGIILQQQLSRQEGSSENARIFAAEELKKATQNYDESLIIGTGGYGTVYKGFLADNRVVAIKKSKIVDQSQIEQFINEVVVLSQINHRNVVKLLGCCLETEVPLLVYEFVNNGTVFDYIHNESTASDISWKTRMRIAAETAGALSYLHSAASMPIIHRDVKTANILLDESYTAKVSDFGASRLVPIDQTELATMVQGTVGYLDPEYMLTSQLTEKSDVYSFGVVLVELLTGRKALSFDRPEAERSLAMYFISSWKEDHLFDVLESGIVNEENMDQLREVAMLAIRCLRMKGEERPSMKELAMELEGIRRTEKHPWVNFDSNQEETEHLLALASNPFNSAGTSEITAEYDSLRNHVILSLDDGR